MQNSYIIFEGHSQNMIARACLILLLISLNTICSANTITVTSNADSGPGSLREAINSANANGTSFIDTIVFNIPDITVNGRTITLQSTLPTLTSKIVIDATTQPGNKFGVSDTKIKIRHSGSTTYSQGLVIFNASDIEIYGIYFNEFRYGDPNLVDIRCALYVPGYNTNIKIGAPGKGNVFYNNAIGIANRYTWGSNPGDRFIDVQIKSNFFGLNEDGITVNSGCSGIIIRSFRNIEIGGTDSTEGNYFAGEIYGNPVVGFYSDSATNNGFFKIINNHFGFDYSKTVSVKCGSIEIKGDDNYYNPIYSDAVVTIAKNNYNNPAIYFSNTLQPVLIISLIKGFITIQGNKIGNLISYFGSTQTTGIFIYNCKDGLIGGSLPAEKNFISSNFSCGVALNNDSNITISKNSIFCNAKGIFAVSNKVAIPFVKISSTNEINFVAGTATPNCKIEVFQNPTPCLVCSNGETFLGETIADNAGNWSLTAPFSAAVTATATTPSGATGEFAEPKYNELLVQIVNPVCNQNNGSITGMQFISGTKWYWVKNSYDTIFNQLDLYNLGPGYYSFVVEQTHYCKKQYNVSLYDNSPHIHTNNMNIVNPSCGLNNGSIQNIYTSGSYNKMYWLNSNRDTVSTQLNLQNVGPGTYKLFVMNTTYGCGDSTNWITLVNQAGPSLNTNNVAITNSICNNPNGSITGITANNVTGIPFIQWVDSLNNPVGNNFDLLNRPGGKYKLKFKDQSNCDTIITQFYVIPAVGVITIDTSGKIVKPAGCTVNNGSIKNVKANGGTSYQWQNLTTGQPAGSTLDIFNLAVGNYQLTATNSFGCTAISSVINVPQAVFIPIGVTGTQARNAVCGQNNGFVAAISFNGNPTFYNFRWVDSTTNQIVGIGTSASNLGGGTYLFIATDSNGCEKQISKATIVAFPAPVFDLSGLSITGDECNQSHGSISGIKLNGLYGPTTYSWADASGNIVGNTVNLYNAPAGQYKLTVNDGPICTIQSNVFMIGNDNNVGPALLYDNLYIAKYTSANLLVKNFLAGNYSLYKDAAASQLLQQNITGNFSVGPLSNDTVFYIQRITGTCISAITTVKIFVVDKSMFAVPKAFTPNRDGLNDLLHVKVIGYIDLEYFKIYNRNGEEVFTTKRINDGWDGRYKGFEQPTGVFVWIAKGKDEKGNIVTDKGTFALIR